MKKIVLVLLGFCNAISCLAQIATSNKSRAIQSPPAAPVIKGAVCQLPTKIWDKTFGGDVDEQLYDVINTKDGGYIMGGFTYSSQSGDKTQPTQGFYDYWIVKIDNSGNKVWDKRFGGDFFDFMRVIVPDKNGGYLLGGTSSSGISGDKTESLMGYSDYWIVKIDANGNKIWDKRFGGNGRDDLNTIAATSDGGYLLGGTTESDLSGDITESSRGIADYWVVKIDSLGNKLWDKRFGGAGIDVNKSVISTPDKGFLLGGYSDSDISGDRTESTRGNYDYWVVKIDSLGNKIWDKRFGGSGSDMLAMVIMTHDNRYILAGTSESPNDGDKTENSRGWSDYWVVKIDDMGNKLWDKRFGSFASDNLTSILATPDGSFLLCGDSNSGIAGDKTEQSNLTDFWVVKINSNGNKIFDKQLGGNNSDFGTIATLTTDGNFLLAGSSSSGISGDKSQASQGWTDYWAIKISICQSVTSFCESQTYTLAATNCAGTVTWSTGAVVNSIEVSNPGTYTATCTVNNETSSASNSIVIVSNTATLNGTAASGTSKAIDSITSTQTIPTGINATYQAGKSISLQGSFQAQTGSVFKAEIKGCE
ncbi:3-coathanger stack domain-containing protein [Emticicia fontis]